MDVKDANGNRLQDGEAALLSRDLKVRRVN